MNPERNRTGTVSEKLWFSKVLSFLFITAGIALLGYFGGTQAGLIETGNSAPDGFYKTERAQAELPADLTFPEIVPFEASEISSVKKWELAESTTYIIVIKGAEEQELMIRYTPGAQFIDQTDPDLPEAIKETSVEIEAAEVNGTAANYHETRYESFLSWQEEDTSVTISYRQGISDEKLGKDELIMVAGSFK
ncbi:hypothetical protein ACOJQI_15515 [Bacillus salacetis]|uniref:hypothetical protein n=1 Tax=Bacillus salacetis TaxID=2315464 RepID=UPI003B9E18F1